jgi:hypothetical protein
VEVDGNCGNSSSFTYLLNGPEAIFVGMGKQHESKYDEYVRTYSFAENALYDGNDTTRAHCEFTISVVPTQTFEETYFTSGPLIFAIVVVMTFLFTTFVFAVYDWMVYRRQKKLLSTAERTSAIVSSLFPKDVHDRIMADADEKVRQEQQAAAAQSSKGFRGPSSAKNRLKGFLDGANHEEEDVETDGISIFKTKPIADLFPEVTVMFTDLVGFTAWSSMREPVHVFTLLETIYHEFDQIAKRRRVFKVETVGDCYVAVAGLPEHRKDHAVVMVRCSTVMFLVDFSNPTATKPFLVSPFVFLRLVLLVIACTRCISWCGS